MPSTHEVYIRGTHADPEARAQVELSERGDEVMAELAAKIALLTELRVPPAMREEALGKLVAFCTDQVPHYLAAIDRALYAAAAGAAETRLLVRGLRIQHRMASDHLAEVARLAGGDPVVASATTVLAVLTACREVERTVLWPALASLPGADLPTLVENLDTLLAGGTLQAPEELDVRTMPHGQRHPQIFGVYARLLPGESFVLVNNHDPKPLRREFEATYRNQFSWNYLESGPEQWRVQIGRSSEHQ